MRNRLINILLFLAIAVLLIHAHDYFRAKYINQGWNDYGQALATCTLEDARRERCFIPCATDSDCLAKNGSTDH